MIFFFSFSFFNVCWKVKIVWVGEVKCYLLFLFFIMWYWLYRLSDKFWFIFFCFFSFILLVSIKEKFGIFWIYLFELEIKKLIFSFVIWIGILLKLDIVFIINKRFFFCMIVVIFFKLFKILEVVLLWIIVSVEINGFFLINCVIICVWGIWCLGIL